jgi:hypothetical protein
MAYTVALKSLDSFEYGGTRDTVCTHQQQSHMRRHQLSSLQKKKSVKFAKAE